MENWKKSLDLPLSTEVLYMLMGVNRIGMGMSACA